MAEYRVAVWLPNKETLTAMFFQAKVREVHVWLTEIAAFNDPNLPLLFRITAMRRDAVEDTSGFAFHIEAGTVAKTDDENAEQIPFTGVFYSPSGLFPSHWSRIEFSEEQPLIVDEV